MGIFEPETDGVFLTASKWQILTSFLSHQPKADQAPAQFNSFQIIAEVWRTQTNTSFIRSLAQALLDN